tara:strand:+ start:537 stop:827 length:291 start_codon:yes stop_codon:yes gene_type:complete
MDTPLQVPEFCESYLPCSAYVRQSQLQCSFLDIQLQSMTKKILGREWPKTQVFKESCSRDKSNLDADMLLEAHRASSGARHRHPSRYSRLEEKLRA